MIYKGYLGSHFDYFGHSSVKCPRTPSKKNVYMLWKLDEKLFNSRERHKILKFQKNDNKDSEYKTYKMFNSINDLSQIILKDHFLIIKDKNIILVIIMIFVVMK